MNFFPETGSRTRNELISPGMLKIPSLAFFQNFSVTLSALVFFAVSPTAFADYAVKNLDVNE